MNFVLIQQPNLIECMKDTMQAATLQTKKAVNKGKIKKTLKNVLCRPDPVFWPTVSENQKQVLESALSEYKVEIPVFQKPHWKELKLMPKDKRPKPPKLKRVEGLFFGISECCNAIKVNSCAAVIVESTVNPRTIVQPVLDACINSRVPLICLSGLRTISASNFGIPTSCLGLKCNSLPNLASQLLEITKNYKLPEISAPVQTECVEMKDVNKVEDVAPKTQLVSTVCPYLYRTSKKTRIFNPSEGTMKDNHSADFSGQDFIEFAGKKDSSNTGNLDRKSYMKMVLKKISNNPKRAKVK